MADKMRILAYKGKSLVSKAIQWQTRSPFSHVGIELLDGTVVEAWHVGGVQRNPTFRTVHSPGTEVAVFSVDHEYSPDHVKMFLLKQVGKKYDFSAIARFVSRRDEPADDKWFCSELALAAFPFLLERIPPSHTTPRDISLSPFLVFKETRLV